MDAVSDNGISLPEDTSSTSACSFDELGLISQQEYETQLFGFTPKSFSDGLYNGTVQYMHDCLTLAAQFMKTELKNGQQSADSLDKAAEQIFQDILPGIGKTFDKLEVFLGQNIMKIKPDLLLEEDFLRLDYPSATSSDIQQLESAIRSSEDKIVALKHCIASLRQELSDTDVLVTELRQVIKRQKSQMTLCHLIADEVAQLKSLGHASC
jgi:hypothetical protein